MDRTQDGVSDLRTRIGLFSGALFSLQESISRVLETMETTEDPKVQILKGNLEDMQNPMEDVERELLAVLEDMKRIKPQLDLSDSSDPKNNLLIQRGNELATCRAQKLRLEAENSELRSAIKEIKRQKETIDTTREQVIYKLKAELDRSEKANEQLQELLANESRKQFELQEQRPQQQKRSYSAPNPRPDTQVPGGHLDVVTTIQRNQALLNELGDKNFENLRLRRENADLVRKTKETLKGVDVLQAQVTTSVANRAELIQRLRTTKQEADVWKQQLQATAAAMIKRHQLERALNEERQWEKISQLNSSRHSSISNMNRSQLKTRNIQVEGWGSMVNGRPTWERR
eukprot:m.73932 g.73932  ORF g.73932 m.73932 type:complete len:345 (+) comp12440_c0_seq3:27-1061(+)